MILAGLSKTQMFEATKAAFEKKELLSPGPGSMCYMMPKQAYLTCVPKIAIKADGRDHRVNSSLHYGAPYADTESVREVNDHSIEIADKTGRKVVATNKLTTSNDGKILTTDWKIISANGKESGGKFDSKRVAEAPAGAPEVSGEWRPIRTNTSEDVISHLQSDSGRICHERSDRGFFHCKVRRKGISP